jgi:hypothetical protein
MVAIVCLLLIASGACSGASDPPPWKKIITEAQGQGEPPASQAAPASNHLVVYLDTSASMAGYVSPDRQGQTIYSRTLQELRTFITLVDPTLNTIVRRIDTNVSAPNSDTLLSQASLDPGVYTGRETNLAGAISLFPQSLEKPNGNGAQAEEDAGGGTPLPPPRFHILVTDGVQSKKEGSADGSCTAGADQFCVRKRILALLNSGWGGYVIGLRSEFKGKIYSEITGGSISYESKKRDPRSYRPFYIYLLSPDRPALDQLVVKLKDRLRPLLAQADGLRALTLTTTYTDGPARADLKVPAESKDALEVSAREENPARFTLRVDVGTEKSSAKPFTLGVVIPWSVNARDSGTPQELAGLVKWELEQVEVSGSGKPASKEMRYPEVKLTGQSIDGDGKVLLEATTQFPRGKGDPDWRVYRLRGRLDTGQHSPPWVPQWSTNIDTTAENGNRTLNLESALLGLWSSAGLEQQKVADIYLRVGAQ